MSKHLHSSWSPLQLNGSIEQFVSDIVWDPLKVLTTHQILDFHQTKKDHWRVLTQTHVFQGLYCFNITCQGSTQEQASPCPTCQGSPLPRGVPMLQTLHVVRMSVFSVGAQLGSWNSLANGSPHDSAAPPSRSTAPPTT